MQTRPTFSVIIPVYNRPKAVVRAIRSVLNQDYPRHLFEIVVVDDCSTDNTYDNITGHLGREVNKLLRHHRNMGRVAARNTGLRNSSKDWICWLDSDDEYVSTYLSHFASAIEEFPNAKIFTCGALVFNDVTKWFRTREAFVPRMGDQFKSGHIGSGSFVFRRDIALEMPEAQHPYGSDDSFSAKAQNIWTGLKEMYGQNEQGQWLPLGNPWGDDYVQFYALTRLNMPLFIPLPLYMQHVRN